MSVSWKSEKDIKVNLKDILSEEMQHFTDLTLQVTLTTHTEQGKIGPGFGCALPLITTRRRITRRDREKQWTKKMQTNNFRNSVCCPSADVQKAALQKCLMWGEPKVFGTLGLAINLFDTTQSSRTPHDHVEEIVDLQA